MYIGATGESVKIFTGGNKNIELVKSWCNLAVNNEKKNICSFWLEIKFSISISKGIDDRSIHIYKVTTRITNANVNWCHHVICTQQFAMI